MSTISSSVRVAGMCVAAAALTLGAALPAAAHAPKLPNPCKLVTVKQIDKALRKAHAKPTISHSTYQKGTAYESKTCTWTYGNTTVTLDVYKKSGGSGGGPSKTTPEPSLGPNGQLGQSTDSSHPSTSVSFTRHGRHVGIYINAKVKPHRMVKLGKHAYKRT